MSHDWSDKAIREAGECIQARDAALDSILKEFGAEALKAASAALDDECTTVPGAYRHGREMRVAQRLLMQLREKAA